ncbi:MAG: hypothetical protein U1E62_24920 [Alsobacter sp.]
MSETVLRAPMALVKIPVASARGMLLTETFKLAGRAAMILEPVAAPSQGQGQPVARDRGSEGDSRIAAGQP